MTTPSPASTPPPTTPPPTTPPPGTGSTAAPVRRFQPLDVGLALATALLVPVAALAGWMFAMDALGASLQVVMLAVPLAAVVALVGLWLVLHRWRGWGWRELGFVAPDHHLAHLLWLVPLAIVGSALVAAVAGSALGLAPASARRDDAGTLGLSVPVKLVLALATVVLLPLVEEVVFRGVLFGWLRQRLSTPLTVLGVSMAFALCHVAPPVMCYVLPLGLAITALRAVYHSVWPGLALHVVNNALVSGIALAAVG